MCVCVFVVVIIYLFIFVNRRRYVDQGGGKRPGAFAVYLEPWHADVFEVLELKKNHGKEELRARCGSISSKQRCGRGSVKYYSHTHTHIYI